MNLADLINQAYEKEEKDNPQKARSYIGASIVGNPCEALIAFSLRGFPDSSIGYRLKRIFRDGHRIEDDVIKDIKKTGIAVMEKDPFTGKQWAFDGFGGHAVGHADGMLGPIDQDSKLLEIKSMNDNKFKEFSTKGVKYSHRHNYSQVQFMLGLGKLKECVFISYNKNNSEYHSELIRYDEFYYNDLCAKVERVLNGEAKKISDDPTDWRCRGCFKRDVCWEEKEVKQTMKTCKNYQPKLAGGWVCSLGCQEECQKWERFQPLPKTSNI